MKKWICFILLLIFGLNGKVDAQSCNRASDSLVMVDFFGALNGIRWTNRWNLNNPMSKWHGVTLNDAGCVVEINLPNNNLDGILPGLHLPHLEVLNLSNNFIIGNLPNFTLNPNLRVVNISGNYCRGALPGFFINDDLVEIDLSFNRLEGAVPDYSNKSHLKVLNLSNNLLTGAIFDFSKLVELEEFELAFNSLTGNITKLSLLPNLRRVYLESNNFTGNISGFTQMADIVYFNVSKNQLTGTLPTILNKEELIIFDVSENQISGNFNWPINAPNLRALDISNNQVQGSIYKENFIDLPRLEELRLSYNQFTGRMPDIKFPMLQFLLVDHNQLEGTIPPLTFLTALKQARFNNNNFTGLQIDHGLFNHIEFLFLEENRLTFDDVINYVSYLNRILYVQPQKTIPFQFESFTITKGNNFTLRLNTEEDNSTTEYNWYQNGLRVNSTFVKELNLSNVNPSRAGKYTVIMRNYRVPGMLLFSDTMDVQVTCPMVVTEETVYICPEEVFVYKGTIYDEPTLIRDTVLSQDIRVCDSVYIIEVMEAENHFTQVSATHCSSDTVYFGPDSTILTASGIYLDTFQSMTGCDSVVELTLEMLPTYNQTLQRYYCSGDTAFYQGQMILTDTIFVDSLLTAEGCDSIWQYQYLFQSPIEVFKSYTLCNGDSIQIGGQIYTESTFFSDTLTAQGGCDSIIHHNVQVYQNYQVTFDTSFCGLDSYDFNGQLITTSGQYRDTLQTIYGCDSIVTLNVAFYPTYAIYDTVALCPGDSIFFDGNYLRNIGTYVHDGSSVNGCDSLHLLTINRLHVVDTTIFLQGCAGDTLWYRDVMYTQSGVYHDTLVNFVGCDTAYHVDVHMANLFVADSTIVGSGSNDSTGQITIDVMGGFAPYTYQWVTGDTMNFIENVPVGEYPVLVEDSLGCRTQFVMSVPLNTFIYPQEYQRKWVNIWPNLISAGDGRPLRFQILQTLDRPEIKLFDAVGQLIQIQRWPLLSKDSDWYWSLPNLNAGLYWIQITEKDSRYYQTEKIMVH